VGRWLSMGARLAIAATCVVAATSQGGQAVAANGRPAGTRVDLAKLTRGVVVRDLERLNYLRTPSHGRNVTAGALNLALLRFQAVGRLDMNGLVDPSTARALAQAMRADASLSPTAVAWKVVVSESRPETVTVYHDGVVWGRTLCNTGIKGAATPPGVYFVFEKLAYQVMRGTNVNGTHYADPVRDIWYFDGGDALHGFVRAAYGFPQSNGCVEVEPAFAARLFARLPLGAEIEVLAGPA